MTYAETVVAELDGQVVGFGCMERAGPDLDVQLRCLAPDVRAFLEPLAELDDANVVIEAAPGRIVTRQEGDVVLTAVAVDPRYRRRGIARALAVARLRLAARSGASQVFVHCVDGSGSRELYEQLGFEPLVRFRRHYSDGTGMALLVRGGQ
jgi:ribosomal protein S18 acetylase RimI-like enzyme